MKKVFVIDGKRSPIGSFLGSLKDVHAADLGAQVLRGLLNENPNVKKEEIDEVIVGNILSAGLGQGIARQIALKANLPVSVVAYSLNMVCGSGMKAVMNAYGNIHAGLHNLVIAGGVESMSNAPYLVSGKVRSGVKFGEMKLLDHMLHDALTDAFNDYHMGITAENVAARYNIDRVKQDELSYKSQQKAIAAVDSGRFKDEIIPITVKTNKGEVLVENDEYPNRTTDLSKLATLRSAFKKDGLVTAGNSSGLNDGASFTIIASEAAVKKYDLKPKAEIIGIGQGGVEPEVMGLGPVPAINAALKMAGLKLEDIELLELNEAFAAQALGVVMELSQIHNISVEEILEKTNLNGGAIALGHPVGASGNRIIVTLLHEMVKRNAKYGLASLCIGGGMGTAIILKLV